MSELNPEQLEEPEEVQPSPVRKWTRRKFIKAGAIATVATGITGSSLTLDFLKGLWRYLEQYGTTPENVQQAINFLEEADINLPHDQLYGFDFPSTKEMAQKYREGLKKTTGDSLGDSKRWLAIVQEKQPNTFTWRLLQFTGAIKKHDDPSTSKPEEGQEGPIYFYIPSSMSKLSTPRLAKILYHEGFHFFLQPGHYPATDQEEFNREIKPNIAEIILERALVNRGDIKNSLQIDIDIAYDQAIKENNRDIFEKELKKLYELPEDCCTYQPPQNLER
ncbi:twin-arginine translocation signal domain-containing protein [Candidatus Microgenomates bacterium]|nr:twin-arginine translocation signal domain-containing protein [Candidatus Microgenomates bacterium]